MIAGSACVGWSRGGLVDFFCLGRCRCRRSVRGGTMRSGFVVSIVAVAVASVAFIFRTGAALMVGSIVLFQASRSGRY
jgi:hypothetical protein